MESVSGGKPSSFKNPHIPPPETSPTLNKSSDADSVENPNINHSNEYGDMGEACAEMDGLINTLSTVKEKSDVPDIPQSSVETFTKMVGSQLDKYIHHDSSFKLGQDSQRDTALINGVTLLCRLTNLLDKFSPDDKVNPALSLTTPVVQRAMAYMEKELRILLQEEPKLVMTTSSEEQQEAQDHEATETDNNNYPGISQDTIQSIRMILGAMISGGYHKDCCHAYTSLRKDSFKEAMKNHHYQGFENNIVMSNDDIQKMQWETLEGHIVDWVKATKHVARVLLPGENTLCVSLFFPDHPTFGETVITNLAKPVVTSLLILAEAVSLTKRSAERLFKVLDIYEALTDLMAALDSSKCSPHCTGQLRSEMLVIRRRLRETIVGIFSDLEQSIKNDAARNPVPGGGVHPLTRYTINYLRYACDFRDTLEHVFAIHQNNEDDEIDDPNHNYANNHKSNNQSSSSESSSDSAFTTNKYAVIAAELIKIMNLLDDNLETKSRLYKDPSLRYIFLMNNGRYILQKIKESSEIREVMGDDFRRKRSSELRGYHKSYQRETWSRVLQCLNQEGLQVNGKVQKTLVKERLKSFNQMFDDIHKTQSAWVVSDKQLQSELRVSISAVMIPAYRSFVARFGQCFGSGKHAEKYIKYQPEDIESSIEGLFDGNGLNLSMARRKISFSH